MTKKTIAKPTKAVETAAPTAAATKKKRRFHPGTVAIRQIIKQQKSKKTAIPRVRVSTLARVIAGDFLSDIRFEPSALALVHSSLEEFIVSISRSSNWALRHANRETAYAKDIKLALRMNEALPKGLYQKLYGFQHGLQQPSTKDNATSPKVLEEVIPF